MRVGADGRVVAARPGWMGPPGDDPAGPGALPAPQPGQDLVAWMLAATGPAHGPEDLPALALTVRASLSGSSLVIHAARSRNDAGSSRPLPRAAATRTPPRLVGFKRRRMFLFDPARALSFELHAGLVHVVLEDGETYVTNYTIRNLMARLPVAGFFRAHRDVIVNLARVKEIERAAHGRLRLLLDTPDARSFVASRPASARLRRLLRL